MEEIPSSSSQSLSAPTLAPADETDEQKFVRIDGEIIAALKRQGFGGKEAKPPRLDSGTCEHGRGAKQPGQRQRNNFNEMRWEISSGS